MNTSSSGTSRLILLHERLLELCSSGQELHLVLPVHAQRRRITISIGVDCARSCFMRLQVFEGSASKD